jgi:hypothetical protein
MEDWIAGSFAVLGTLMVLAGGTLIVLRTLGRIGPPPEAEGPATPTAGAAVPASEPGLGRRFSLRHLSPATQLIGWGILLLVVAAFAVDLINFTFDLNADTR